MKRYGIYLICGILMSLSFASCAEEDDEDDIYTIGKEYDGTYLGALKVIDFQGAEQNMPQKVYLRKSHKDEHVNLEIKYLAVSPDKTINLSLTDVLATTDQEGGVLTLFKSDVVESSAIESPFNVLLNGTVNKGAMELSIGFTSDNTELELPQTMDFRGELDTQNTSSAAEVVSLMLDTRIFLEEATKSYSSTNEIFLGLQKGVTPDQLKNYPLELVLSGGATCEPASGTPRDFTKPVTYVITSEDKIVKKKVTVAIFERSELLTFDTWQVANPTAVPGKQYTVPASQGAFKWNSYDGRIAPLMNYPTENLEFPNEPVKPVEMYSVRPTADAVSGKAVEIVSQWGKAQPTVKVPSLIAGVLYTGNFEINLNGFNNDARFGVPMHYKTTGIKFSYKYKRGETTYQPSAPALPYDAVEVDLPDEFMVMAVVYRVANRFDEREMLSYSELFNSEKVVARGMFISGEEKDSFTEVVVPIEYDTEFSYGVDYRIALFFTASKDQDVFLMAPGSVLTIDNLMLITD